MCTVTNGANIAFFLELNTISISSVYLKQERDYIKERMRQVKEEQSNNLERRQQQVEWHQFRKDI